MQKGKISPLFWVGIGIVGAICLPLAAVKTPRATAIAAYVVVAAGGLGVMVWALIPDKPSGNSRDDGEAELEPEFVPLPPPLPPLAPSDARGMEMVEVEYFQPEPLKMMKLEFENDSK